MVPLPSTGTTGSLVSSNLPLATTGIVNAWEITIGCSVTGGDNLLHQNGIRKTTRDKSSGIHVEKVDWRRSKCNLLSSEVTTGTLRLIAVTNDCCWNEGFGLRSKLSKKTILIIIPSGLTGNEVLMGVGCTEAHSLGWASVTFSWLWLQFPAQSLCTQYVILWDSAPRLAALSWDKVPFNSFSSVLSGKSSD